MRIRSILVAAVAAAALAPATASQAGTANPEDCSSLIEVWSGKGFTTSSPNSWNCPVQASEMTTSPFLPGGDMIVNFAGEKPVERDPLAANPNFGSYLAYTSSSATGVATPQKVWLRSWAPATADVGTPTGWNAPPMSIAARDSVTAGDLTFVVIEPVRDPFDQAAQQCKVPGDPTSGCWTVHTRVYKTISNWFDGA